MTVYELIQKLTEYPPDMDIIVRMYGTDRQAEEYTEDWHRMKKDGVRFDGHIEDLHQGDMPWLTIDCEVDDL